MIIRTGICEGHGWAGRRDDDRPECEEPDDRHTAKLGVGQRVSSTDYGGGTVVAVFGDEAQVMWDKPMLDGTANCVFTHDRVFVERLTRLYPVGEGRDSPVS